MKCQRPVQTGKKKDAPMSFRHWILCAAALLSLTAALGLFPKNEHAERPGYDITRTLQHAEPESRDAVL